MIEEIIERVRSETGSAYGASGEAQIDARKLADAYEELRAEANATAFAVEKMLRILGQHGSHDD